MAIAAATVWEVRTTGSDNNGGGFVAGASGTDYSQQDAAQFSGTNLASSNGTTNPSVVSSATHNFVATDVGNIIQITAGTNWTTGFYQIVSVATNAATLDRAVGTAASLTSGTWALGGALSSPAMAVGGMVAGNDVWIKSGTYTITSSTGNVSNGRIIIGSSLGSQSDMAHFRGYYTSRWNTVTGPTNDDIVNAPVYRVGISTFHFLQNTGSGIYHELHNLILDGNNFALASYQNNTSSATSSWPLRRVVFINCGTVGAASTGGMLNRCVFSGTDAQLSGTQGAVFECISSGKTGTGITTSAFLITTGGMIANCVASNAGVGFAMASTAHASCVNCSAYTSNNAFMAVWFQTYIGCAAYSTGSSDYSNTSGNDGSRLINCAGRASGTGFTSSQFTYTENYQSVVSEPFMSGFNGNMTPRLGSPLRDNGPFNSPLSTTTGYLSIGAAGYPPMSAGYADTMKVLGQADPGTTLTTVYTVPATYMAVISSILVCNQTSAPITFRIALNVGGAVTASSSYIYYNQSLGANESFEASSLTLSAGDGLSVYASASGVSFNVFGTESA